MLRRIGDVQLAQRMVLFEALPLSLSETALDGSFDYSEIFEYRCELYFILQLLETVYKEPVLSRFLAAETATFFRHDIL